MSRQDGSRNERGESLLELLISTTLLGVAVSAIIAALGILASASSLHHDRSGAQNLLRTWAEQLEQSPPADCVQAASVYRPADAGGFTYAVEGVQYWNGSAFAGSCTPIAGSPGQGLQRISLAVTAPKAYGGLTLRLQLVVRAP